MEEVESDSSMVAWALVMEVVETCNSMEAWELVKVVVEICSSKQELEEEVTCRCKELVKALVA